jgi:hypothetical protein
LQAEASVLSLDLKLSIMEWSTASFWLADEQYDKVSKNIKFLSYLTNGWTWMPNTGKFCMTVSWMQSWIQSNWTLTMY